METANHEYYVSLEVAKLLKKAGFDWTIGCDFVYAIFNDRTEFLNNIYVINAYQSNLRPGLRPIDRDSYVCKYHAPTLDVAQRWLREVKGFNINTCWLPKTLYGNERFVWNAYFACDFLREGKPMHDVVSYGNNIEYCTYEEAQEAGIKKTLELILEKEE